MPHESLAMARASGGAYGAGCHPQGTGLISPRASEHRTDIVGLSMGNPSDSGAAAGGGVLWAGVQRCGQGTHLQSQSPTIPEECYLCQCGHKDGETLG